MYRYKYPNVNIYRLNSNRQGHKQAGFILSVNKENLQMKHSTNIKEKIISRDGENDKLLCDFII